MQCALSEYRDDKGGGGVCVGGDNQMLKMGELSHWLRETIDLHWPPLFSLLPSSSSTCPGQFNYQCLLLCHAVYKHQTPSRGFKSHTHRRFGIDSCRQQGH